MEINQFVEFGAAVLRSLPRNLDSATAQRWIREQGALAEALRGALKPNTSYELYLAPGQQNGGVMKGFDLEKHLEETDRLARAYSFKDELVEGWLDSPETYPEELKTGAVFLWKSKRASGSDRRVACLCWHDDRVFMYWRWLVNRWGDGDPALLASS